MRVRHCSKLACYGAALNPRNTAEVRVWRHNLCRSGQTACQDVSGLSLRVSIERYMTEAQYCRLLPCFLPRVTQSPNPRRADCVVQCGTVSVKLGWSSREVGQRTASSIVLFSALLSLNLSCFSVDICVIFLVETTFCEPVQVHVFYSMRHKYLSSLLEDAL